jgi:hypothetical protein
MRYKRASISLLVAGAPQRAGIGQSAHLSVGAAKFAEDFKGKIHWHGIKVYTRRDRFLADFINTHSGIQAVSERQVGDFVREFSVKCQDPIS